MLSSLDNRILLVEDDDDLAFEIVKALADAAFSVGRIDPQHLLGGDSNAAVIILDRLVKNEDCIHLLERMRAARDRTPVIIISGLGSVDERVNGLLAGADDYLTKPFAMKELVARVVAACRRYDLERKTKLVVGPLELDRVTRIARRNDRTIELLPREYALLEMLMENAGHVVTRSTLIERIWKQRVSSSTNVVDVYIGHLRRKIDGDEPDRLLANLRGLGFRLGHKDPKTPKGRATKVAAADQSEV